jgi:hypothetical protein
LKTAAAKNARRSSIFHWNCRRKNGKALTKAGISSTNQEDAGPG